MKNLAGLEEYIEKTEDVQLGMMVEIVKEYGNDIPEIINTIKERHIDNDNKENAEMIFSTVHRCKGMEYDAIQIVNDFISEEKVEKLAADARKDELNDAKLNEEINLLYVAITRTRNRIYMPETLMPADFAPSKQIHVMRAAIAQLPHRGDVVATVLGESCHAPRAGQSLRSPAGPAFPGSTGNLLMPDAFHQ